MVLRLSLIDSKLILQNLIVYNSILECPIGFKITSDYVKIDITKFNSLQRFCYSLLSCELYVTHFEQRLEHNHLNVKLDIFP